MPSEFLPKPGDTVRLKSGGPVMKVRFVAFDHAIAYCEWTEQGRTNVGTFKLDELSPGTGPDPDPAPDADLEGTPTPRLGHPGL